MDVGQANRRKETLLEGIIAQAKKMPQAHYDTIAAFLVMESILPTEYQAFNFGRYNGEVQGLSLGMLIASAIEHPPSLMLGVKDSLYEFSIQSRDTFRFFRNLGIFMTGVGANISGIGYYDYVCLILAIVAEASRAGLDYKMDEIKEYGD